METVWITGASSGLGYYTAEALRRAGYRVIAGARSFTGSEKDCLPLDVTDPESVDRFVREALTRTGTPDVLINCAAVLNLGACETYSEAELRRVMDTNFFGMTAMVSRVVPLMRARKKGRVINFSSINGLFGIPFEGAYTASKHAIEGYSECLALECAPFGIEVMLVEPGDHRGGSSRCRAHGAAMGADSPYAETYARATAAIARDEKNGSDPEKLGEKIVKTLRKKRLPRRLRVAKFDQLLSVWLHDLLPNHLFDRLLLGYYTKK